MSDKLKAVRERLEGMKARADAATTGPWEAEIRHGQDCIWYDVMAGEDVEVLSAPVGAQLYWIHEDHKKATEEANLQCLRNIEFAAATRTDVPACIELIEALLTEREFHQNKGSWFAADGGSNWFVTHAEHVQMEDLDESSEAALEEFAAGKDNKV